MILAEESQDRLPGGDVGLQGGRRGELAADEADAADLDLGSLEDLDHDLGIARLAPFEQLDLGQVVALLVVEPEDVAQRHLGAHGIGAGIDLQSGGILDLLLTDGFSPPKLDGGQDGHLVDDEGQDELPALGLGFIAVDLDVGEPFGVHQRLDIGVDLLHLERLADPAQELGPDFLGRDRGVPLKSDLGDGPLGELARPARRRGKCRRSRAAGPMMPVRAAVPERRAPRHIRGRDGDGDEGTLVPRAGIGIAAPAPTPVGSPGVRRIRPTGAILAAGGIWRTSDLMSDRFLTQPIGSRPDDVIRDTGVVLEAGTRIRRP